jgi:hypothetical protein
VKIVENPDENKRQLEERCRQALAALQAYMENRKNPLSGPQFAKFVDDFFAAKGALVSAR